MEPTKALTTQDVSDGIGAAVGLRRAYIWYGFKMAAVMAGCGFLLVGIGYFKNGNISWWALLFPAGLSAVVLLNPVREVLRLNRLIAIFRSAERKVASGEIVLAQDIFPSGVAERPN